MRTTQQEGKNEKTTEQENVIGKEADTSTCRLCMCMYSM